MPHDRRIDAASDVKVGVWIVAQLGDRSHTAALGIANQVLGQQIIGDFFVAQPLQLERHQQGNVPSLGGLDQVRRRRDVGDAVVLEHGDLHCALTIDHICCRQVAQACLPDHQLAKFNLVSGNGRCSVVEVARHVDNVGADDLAVLEQIGIADLQ
jgi:hypothetical protein